MRFVLNRYQLMCGPSSTFMATGWNGIIARERGMIVYQSLKSQCPGPIRFIMFTWPSQREGRVGPDVRAKAALAHVESYYLASSFETCQAISLSA